MCIGNYTTCSHLSDVRTLCIFIFLAAAFPATAQSPSGGFKSLSGPEKWWVVFHPFVAKRAYRVSLEARHVSKEMESDSLLDGDANGGQVDAFRHAYWMARLSQVMCWKKARSLGKAHEKGNYKEWKKGKKEEGTRADSAACAMDLFNNEAGLKTGRSMKDIPADSLRRMVRDSVRAGGMQVILKNALGQPLDCNAQPIDLAVYENVWNVPKCLVRSDQGKKE